VRDSESNNETVERSDAVDNCADAADFEGKDGWFEEAFTLEEERLAREELAEDEENVRSAVWSGAPSYCG